MPASASGSSLPCWPVVPARRRRQRLIVRVPWLVRRVLVTGGLGFIGSAVSAALLDRGADVRVVDDLSGAYASGTGPAAASALAAGGAEVTIGAADPALVQSVDAVIHLAALPGVRTRRAPSALHEANVLLTERL